MKIKHHIYELVVLMKSRSKIIVKKDELLKQYKDAHNLFEKTIISKKITKLREDLDKVNKDIELCKLKIYSIRKSKKIEYTLNDNAIDPVSTDA